LAIYCQEATSVQGKETGAGARAPGGFLGAERVAAAVPRTAVSTG